MEEPFGWELLLDLYECDVNVLKSREALAQYVIAVCERLEMKRFGEPLIEHFGYEKATTVGYSLVQLIETSAIVGHFSELKRAAYLDLFSCKPFDPNAVTEFTKEFFGAQRVVQRLIERN
ncbi:MAG TPA: S-adenosylmethionine decarboxylase [Anaerolineae bacterium]|nr:S-adenosylmethionine decarboxylase [Anaerolineae bacterium]